MGVVDVSIRQKPLTPLDGGVNGLEKLTFADDFFDEFRLGGRDLAYLSIHQ